MSSGATAHLGDVASFIRGITFKPDDVVPVGSSGSVACMRTKNVQTDLDLSDVWGIPESLVKRDDQYLAAGDLLVSSANSWNLVGKCCWVPPLPWRATFGGFISALRGDRKKIEPRYLYHWFSSPRIQATVRGFGQQTTNISNLNVERCLRLPLPLPPIPEQRRIAEILDKADALRAKRRAALAQLDTLTQSIFLDMFGDPATNPKGWRIGRLEDQITSVRYGTGSPPPYVDDGLPFIRATNIKAGTISAKDLKRISSDEAARIEKCRVRAGNLIIVRSGVNTGDCAIVPSEYDGAYAAFDLIVELPWANAVFYNFLINSPHGKAHLEPLTRRAAQPHLNAEQVRSLRFISPDESTKQRFAALVGSIDKQKGRGDANLRELDALFGALQHSAFRGEL